MERKRNGKAAERQVVIAIDSWKGSLSSLEAGRAAEAGIREAALEAGLEEGDLKTRVYPLADGGEGTAEAFIAGRGGQRRTVRVRGPLGRLTEASYGIVETEAGGKTERLAVIEMAAAAGLTLLEEKERDPLHASTAGVGDLILDAIGQGCSRFLIGIGGSATNDGGAGMLQTLGFSLLNGEGRPVGPGCAGLQELCRIETKGVPQALRDCCFRIACDVTNPLCGPEGCSAVYGPQKGALPEQTGRMDGWLSRFAVLTERQAGVPAGAFSHKPGAGAAGGLGFAFLAFLKGSLEPGVKIVLEELGLSEAVREAELVVTGEGRLDAQTAMGKAPAGMAALAKEYQKPVVAFTGCLGDGAQACHAAGIDAYFPVLPGPMPVEEAMRPETAAANLRACAKEVFRLWLAAGRLRKQP